MPTWNKLNFVDLTVDSIATADLINDIGGNLNDAHDVVVTKHTAAGVHDDDLLTRGWAYVTQTSSAATLAASSGVVSSVTWKADGKVAISFSPNSATPAAENVIPQATPINTSAYRATVEVTGVDEVTVYTFNSSDVQAFSDFFVTIKYIPA